MWFGVGDESKIALIFYASFFPVFVNTIAGVVSTDHSYIEVDPAWVQTGSGYFYGNRTIGGITYLYRNKAWTGLIICMCCGSWRCLSEVMDWVI